MSQLIESPRDTKKTFRECGTCSRTFVHILNREFGHTKEAEERALDPLAGGLMNTGHQCGMLWGAALAAGAEAFRRYDNPNQAITVAVKATQHIMKSFINRTNTPNCREITGCDLSSFFGLLKFMVKSTIKGLENNTCFNLAEQWAPEAIQSAKEGLSDKEIDFNQHSANCAAEVVKKMGGSDEEMAMVAGFAGGLGLSGNACGALSAALWMNTLDWCRKNPGKTPPYFNNPNTKKILKAFYEATDSEILCRKISGQSFEKIEDHTAFIKNGGCEKLIDALAKA